MSNEIISANTLNSKYDGEILDGLVYISEFSTKVSAKGTEYVVGTALSKSGPVPFKIWDTRLLSQISTNKSYHIVGKVNEYNGNKSLVINGVTTEVVADISDFESSIYDPKDLRKSFTDIVRANLTEDGLSIFKALLGDSYKAFFNEYAARRAGKNHDNVRHGLLAHSLKVTMVLDFVYNTYSLSDTDFDKDLLFIGVSLHDMGKVQEYANGVMSEHGMLVSHRSFATETLTLNKELVVSLKGEEWYYRLMSIFAQHHGEYEEKPRTFEAMVVHLIDSFEANMTGVLATYDTRDKHQSTWYNGFPLK